MQLANSLKIERLPDAVITFGKLKIVPEYGGVADDGYRVGFAGQLVLPEKSSKSINGCYTDIFSVFLLYAYCH